MRAPPCRWSFQGAEDERPATPAGPASSTNNGPAGKAPRGGPSACYNTIVSLGAKSGVSPRLPRARSGDGFSNHSLFCPFPPRTP